MSEPIVSVWLVRTERNVISGPFPKERIVALIEEKSLSAQDELCCSSGYWFYLYEAHEVKTQLGIEPPAFSARGEEGTDEITLTQTQPDMTPPTGPETFAAKNDVQASARRSARAGSGQAAGLAPGSGASNYVPPRGLEGASFWRGVIGALLVIVCVLLISVFRALHRQG